MLLQGNMCTSCFSNGIRQYLDALWKGNAHGRMTAGRDPLGDDSSFKIVRISLNCLRPTNPNSTSKGNPSADAKINCSRASETLMTTFSSSDF